MANLLQETNEVLLENGYKWEDVNFIGSADGEYFCTYEEFKVLADVEYNDGYGGQEVASDLVIRLNDGGLLYRHEYDGAEEWYVHKPIPVGVEIKKIKRLTGGSWDDLKTLNKENTNG